MIGELSNNQINNLLSSHVMGRLACTDGEKPYIVPVTYTYDGEYIYGQTNFGKKLKMLRKNPNVCFEVDQMTDLQNWQSIIIYGEFEELKKDKSEKGRDILFGNIFSMETKSTVHAHEHEVTAATEEHEWVKFVMFRIKIKKITSRFEKQ